MVHGIVLVLGIHNSVRQPNRGRIRFGFRKRVAVKNGLSGLLVEQGMVQGIPPVSVDREVVSQTIYKSGVKI